MKDPASVATDFSASLISVVNPAGGTVLGSLGASVGTDGATTMWRTPWINDDLTVHGDVTLVLTVGSGMPAISISGNDGITLAPGATLKIYTEGDVALTGNGLLNDSARADAFQLWGTSASGVPQSIQVSGNGALNGLVYAPNGKITIAGNGDVMGAIVGNTITMSGNAAFHYDESLANWGAAMPYGVSRWRELATAAEREVYETALAFGP